MAALLPIPAPVSEGFCCSSLGITSSWTVHVPLGVMHITVFGIYISYQHKMFSIFLYIFPLLYLLEEVSVQTLFVNCYFHFVELKSSMNILKQSPLSDFADGLPWWLRR